MGELNMREQMANNQGYAAGAYQTDAAQAQIGRDLSRAVAGECVRKTAKHKMREQAEQLRRRATQLDSLADALPEKLSHEADTALWDLLRPT